MTACYDVTWCDDVTSWRFVSCNNISVYTCKNPFQWQSVRLCVCLSVCLCVRAPVCLCVHCIYCRPTSHHVAQSPAAAASDGQISKSWIASHSLISKSLQPAIRVSRPAWSLDHLFGLGLGLGLGLMRYWSRVSYVLVSWSQSDHLLFFN